MNESDLDTWVDYDYALVRLAPRVHVGSFINIGVVLHARTARFLGIRLHLDRARAEGLCPRHLDLDRVARYLQAYDCVCRGGPGAGPIGQLPPSERFHWLTATRSTVLQTSELHAGRTRDPEATLDTLFAAVVEAGTDA